MNMIKSIILSIVITFVLPQTALTLAMGSMLQPKCIPDCAWADAVVDYSPGPLANGPFNDPNKALGSVSKNPFDIVSLGSGGSLTVKFIDNVLTTSGNHIPDLFIFERGRAVEQMQVSISIYGDDWLDVGVFRGQPVGIDIDRTSGIVQGEAYRYVRITDIIGDFPSKCPLPWSGVDIDAVGTLSSCTPVPEPESYVMVLLGLSIMIMSRKFKQGGVL